MPDPIIATSFAALLGPFSACFTSPSFVLFRHLVAGWLLCIGRHTVTGIVVAGGLIDLRHHTSWHRFFGDGRWNPDAVGRQLLRLILQKLVPPFAPILVALDDTLARHTGKHIASAGVHRDPLLSTATKVAYHFGHVWVVLAVVVKAPWGKAFALPVLARLYRSKKTCERLKIPHRTKTALARQLIHILAAEVPNRKLVLVVDNGFANRNVISDLPKNVTLIGRGVLNARIFALPDNGSRPRRGRPRIKGEHLPSPEQHAKDPAADWQTIDLQISGRPAQVKVQVFDALWHKSGKGCYLRFVLIRGWPGHKKDDVLICNDTNADAKWVIETYCLRWPIEETFHWCKSKLGLEDPQNRTERAVQRTAPMSLWCYSLVVVWYLTVGGSLPEATLRRLPWYSGKTNPSFSDMLAVLRRASWRSVLSKSVAIGDRVDRTSSFQNSQDALIDAAGYG